MVVTPWGDSEALRERMLTPGPSNDREAAAENQRQRLFGAMVASVAERGYANTRVADLVEVSGVSLRSFYDLFADKQSCFAAAVDSLTQSTIDLVLEAPPEDDWEEDSKLRLQTIASLVEAQPAAARMCLVEAYAAGPQTTGLVEEAAARIERLIRERLAASPRWSEMPPELASVAVGAILETFRSRLIGGRVKQIPASAQQLATLFLGYEPPARPLRSAARAPEVRPEELEASDHAERALRAFEALLTHQPYAETTMEQVAKRAGMSVRTLYANFAGRDELLLAAIDSAGAQAVAAALPAYRREASPAEGIRAAVTALLGLLASRPNLAHLLLTGTYEGGAAALRRRSEALRPLEAMLTRAAPSQLSVSRVLLSEAVLGGLLWLARRRIAEAGPGALLGLAPICTYIALGPLLGAEQATAAAEGKSYRRQAPDLAQSLRVSATNPHTVRVLSLLSQEPLSVEGLAEKAALPREEIEAQVGRLKEAGVIEPAPGAAAGGPPVYQSRWPVWSTAEWERRSQSEREALSAEINAAMRVEIDDAVAAGSFDLHPERFLVRLPLWIDEQGWRELHDALNLSLEECQSIQRRARRRLEEGESASDGFPVRVHLVSFEPAPPEQEPGGEP
ncbi:MAG TPA: TetR/AcrR family transcriptional regulator [Solirubrobacterales bacterium]|nr:TetR/AcrR family transcriptional regulator [Solirubrobacterales bacterium]